MIDLDATDVTLDIAAGQKREWLVLGHLRRLMQEYSKSKTDIRSIGVRLLQEWRDDFLTWDPAQYNNLQKIIVSPTQMWIPHLAIGNRFAHLRTAHKAGPSANESVPYLRRTKFHQVTSV